MEDQIEQKKSSKYSPWLIGLIVLLAIIWLIYGTLSPCGILKKEIANQAKKEGGQMGYVLFGGFIDRAIDTLNPIQCMGGVFKIWTGSTVDEVLKDAGK